MPKRWVQIAVLLLLIAVAGLVAFAVSRGGQAEEVSAAYALADAGFRSR